MEKKETVKIIVCIVLFFVFGGLTTLFTLVDLDLSILEFSSINGVIAKREELLKLESELQVAEKRYEESKKILSSSQSSFKSAKNKYEAISDETINLIKEATTEENYDIEPTEGTVNDTYIPEGERELQKQHTVLSDGLDDFDSPISDDNEDDNKKSGFIASGLEAYENSAKGKVVTTDIPPRQKTTDSMFGRSKGHRKIEADKK